MNEPKLNRKERRALMFGTVNDLARSQHAEAAASAKAKAAAYEARFQTKTVKVHDDGMIYIPEFQRGSLWENVIPYMVPYGDIPDGCKKMGWRAIEGQRSADNPAAYHAFVSGWFFNGILNVDFHFRPNVVTVDGDITQEKLHKAFLQYVGTILRSFDPSHEHKMAYIVYCIDTCCSKIDFQPRDRELQVKD